MSTYEIIMTPDATTDLVEIRNYIADVLLVPDIALAYIRTIRTEINKLASMPQTAWQQLLNSSRRLTLSGLDGILYMNNFYV